MEFEGRCRKGQPLHKGVAKAILTSANVEEDQVLLKLFKIFRETGAAGLNFLLDGALQEIEEIKKEEKK